MYALVDCNNFYVSCERVFNPALEGKPVVVLSNNDGCVISRSNEAKLLGIKMAEPAFKRNDFYKQNDVHVFSSNYALYGDMSQRVMDTLSKFSPDMEVYSIDECFLLLKEQKYIDLKKYAETICRTVKINTGLPVGVGIAVNKTLSKIANRIAKKYSRLNNVCCINTKEQLLWALKNTPVSDVWGVGRNHSRMLLRHNICTAHDLAIAPAKWVQKNMTITGSRIQEELCGNVCIELEMNEQSKKNICTARSFGKKLSDPLIIREAIANYAGKCAAKLRKQNTAANLITVFIHTDPFKPDLPQYNKSLTVHTEVATNSTLIIVDYAMQVFNRIYKGGYLYKKAGVIVSGIVDYKNFQTKLFTNIDIDKHNKIMNALDNVTIKYGKGIVKVAVEGDGKEWMLRQQNLSNRYTTKWDELMEIKL